MEKKLRNTELIAFRVTESLKQKYDARCLGDGMTIASALRCHMRAAIGNEPVEDMTDAEIDALIAKLQAKKRAPKPTTTTEGGRSEDNVTDKPRQ